MIDLIRQLSQLLTPREKRHAGFLLCAMLIGSLLEMVGVGAVPAFVSALTNPEAIHRHAVGRRLIEAFGIESNERLVVVGAGSLLALFVIKNSYLTVLSFFQARYVFNRQVTISQRLLGAYLYSSYPFHLRRNTAELLRNTNQDAMQIVGSGLMPLLQLVMELFTVTSVLVLLLVVEPLTSLAAFVILGGTTGLFLRLVRGRMLRAGQLERECRQGMLQAVNEGLGGIKTTKVLGRERHFLEAFSRAADGYAVAGRARQVLQDTPRLVLETVAVAGLLAVASLLLARGRSVDTLIPTLTLLGVAVVRMIPSFNRITSALNGMRFGQAAIQGVRKDLLELEQPKPASVERLAFESSIRLDHVTFSYLSAASPSLRDVTLEIPKGSAVGFVGPTGSGKTTLVDVVLGLLEPSQGEVCVDGRSIRGRESAWQQQIGYIPQDIYLADASIRQNIAFGLSPDVIDDEALSRALRAAQLDEFVASLPAGLDTIVGERGVRLSGGQRQRIGIARALYHDPAVLVMDEATSSLDNETERFVMQAIERLRGERTLVIIAHRLSTVEACDCLFFLRDGQLTAQGTYQELQQQSAEFSRMVASDA